MMRASSPHRAPAIAIVTEPAERGRVRCHAKGKRSRRAEFLDVSSSGASRATPASAGKNLAGALGPISEIVSESADAATRDEYFLFARRRGDDDAERWLPLGDVSFSREHGNVDDVCRERYGILVDYAKRRFLKLCVGKAEIEIGARVQRGVRHPRATSETDVVVVADASSPTWDPRDGEDAVKKFGKHPAVLRLMNNAEPVTSAIKNQMLRASTQFASNAGGAPGAMTTRVSQANVPRRVGSG